jgi:hypothetical protein
MNEFVSERARPGGSGMFDRVRIIGSWVVRWFPTLEGLDDGFTPIFRVTQMPLPEGRFVYGC